MESRARHVLRLARYYLECWGYIVRPFDMLADRRRWFWQAPVRCWRYPVSRR